MLRTACSLIGASLAMICALVALLLSDALSPGRLPPMLAFWGAVGAGGLLIAGLMLLERGSRLVPQFGPARFPQARYQ